MTQRYTRLLGRLLGLLLALLAGTSAVRAQSGPYGNEWIVPTQTYYKIKITRDGIYRLDQAYLTQAGLSASTNPQRLQLWRRGQQVALYGGGNQVQLDQSTYFEFFGQRNDGQLDQEMYKAAGDQPHKLYSLFTDTAAYFLTVSATTNGKRMTETATAATGTVHPQWLQPRLRLMVNPELQNYSFTVPWSAQPVNSFGGRGYFYGQGAEQGVYFPWADKGEGFATHGIEDSFTFVMDSLFNRSGGSGAQTWLEILLIGSSRLAVTHSTTLSVLPGGTGAPRQLTTVNYPQFSSRKVVVRLQPGDIGANGRVGIRAAVPSPTNPVTDRFRIGYIRVVSSQATRWRSGQRALQFWNDSTQAGPAYYVLDSIPATVGGYDVTDPANVRRTAGVALSGQQRAYGFASAAGSTRRLLLADGARALVPGRAQRVYFRALNPASYNFLIVTSKALMRPAGAVANPVRDYATYRATAAPGRLAYDTLVVTSDLLYDQFHYGERSPLAVRHFAQYMRTAPRADRYLLLLGKGVMLSEDKGQYGFYRQASATERASVPDLVPATTRSGSDVFFTADWPSGSYVPRMVTGRVPAQTPEQVVNYLKKLQAHEVPTLAPWRKNVLHMEGGQNAMEHQWFRGYLREYQRLAEKPFFGGHVDTVNNTVDGTSTVDISPQVNAGLALITYFGHGSNSVLELNPLPIELSSSNYRNINKYPVFMAGGCAIGNTYGGFGSIGENWLLLPDKGAVGWMADSDFGLESDQDNYLRRVYELMFNDATWYGKPIAAVQGEVLQRLQAQWAQGLTAYRVSMLMNITWQGDPALAMFSPDKPDYQFTPATAQVSIEAVSPGPILASSQRFNLRLQLSNYGKIVRTPLRITIGRTATAAGSTTALPQTVVTIPYYRRDTTIVVAMTNPVSGAAFGNNTFTVTLDNPNVIDERDETNNVATLNYNFLNGGITILAPNEYAIASRANVRLVGQSNSPLSQPLNYQFQLDTIPAFSSRFARTYTVQARDLVTWTPGLPAPVAGRDSVVYYWRVRFSPAGAPAGLDTTWVNSSFRFINGSPKGWSQSHYGQMASAAKTKVSQTVPGGRWEFNEITRSLRLQTVGAPTDDLSQNTFLTAYGMTVDGRLIQGDNCGRPGLNPTNANTISPANIMVAVFEGKRLRQLNTIPGGNYSRCGDVGRDTYFHFATTANRRDSLGLDNINTSRRQGQLLALLQNVPNGAYVALVSMNRVHFSSFRADLKAQLAAMGSQLINSAQDGDPLVMVLRKGFPAQAQEATFSPASPTPRDSQVVALNYTLRSREGAGTVVSTRIGPAQEWQTLYHTIKRPEASDAYTLRLIGYDANNQRQVLLPNVTNPAQALTAVSAQQYPYLQLEAELRDTVNLTAPQLKQWLVTYRGVPEGVVRRDHPGIPAGAYDAATLSAAANTGILTIPVYFENVSDVDFLARTRAKAIITETRNGGRVDTVSIRATRAAGFSLRPRADSTAVYNFRLNVAGVRGPATLRLIANSQELPEQVYYNNELNLSFTAPDISVPPVLDVAFDGTHILNGDIVSPNPEVLVDVRYEDKRRPLIDPTKVQLLLTRPNAAPEVVPMTNSALIRFVNDSSAGRTRVYYTPGTLPDGVYKLEVQAKDMGDNQVAAQRYGVTFEVVNKTSITNVFPYPNPITSKARFVFTLTGSTPPRNMKIQILTVTGKVVREIMQSELGPLRIGNNVSSYAWDGTDEYGDRLANGTYLYRVVLDDPDGQYEHRRTAADQAFKKGWGKLVLLR
ncbi:putative type IX secretion system sortase PorU2 [Hymenobacter jeollabukensis]|nr:C25 family cysteine peptidase [Hymenobacter jeollabukensis]